jgi:hypothetical protein
MFFYFRELSAWKVRIFCQHFQSDVIAEIVIKIELALRIFDEKVKFLEIELLEIFGEISSSRSQWLMFFGLDFIRGFGPRLNGVICDSLRGSGMIWSLNSGEESVSMFLGGGIWGTESFGKMELSFGEMELIFGMIKDRVMVERWRWFVGGIEIVRLWIG